MSEARTATRRKKFSVDELFADTSPRAAGVEDLVEAKLISVERIEPDPEQPRKTFDEGPLQELALSIRAEGVLQPIAVRYDAERDSYVIIHGERRWRAAKIAELETVPALVRDAPQTRRLVQQLMENILREDLNALDRAAALRALKAQMADASWDQVAEAVGIRRSRLFQLLGTEKLADTLQEALRRGIVSEKQTRQVQSMPDDLQRDLGVALLYGELDPKRLQEAVQAARFGRGPSKVPTTGPRPASVATTARKQAATLRLTLGKLDDPLLSALDARAMTALREELEALDEQIERVLARGTS